MRLAIDLRSLMETGGKVSGIENYVLNTIEKLPAQMQDSFGFYNNFKTVSMPKLPSSLEVKRTRIPNKILNTAVRFLNFPKFEKLYKPFDVLWMPDLRPFAIEKKTKLVLTVHDFSPVMHPEFFSKKQRIWHGLINYKKSFKRADLLIAISQYTKDELVRIFNITAEKIKVIYPGLNHEVFNTNISQEKKNEVAKKYSLPNKFILSICTIEPRKNLMSLVKAFEEISDPDLHLVIAGRPGWLYKDLFKYIDNSVKKDKILRVGYIEEGEKAALIANAKVVCYPSFYEGFGFVPLEAMAVGVPVITSARTAMAEVCADAAILVEPYVIVDIKSAIEGIINDEKLRSSLIQKGLERVKMFSWEKCSQEIKEAIATL